MNSLEFIYPQFFIMFLLPLIWLTYILVTKKRSEQNIFSPEILKKLTTSSGGVTIRVRTVLTFISLFLMITALARPVIKEGVVEIESKSVDIVIALDISKSMLAKDRYPNRLDFSKRKIIEIIQGLNRNRVGVIAFANSGYTVSPLTFDKQGVEYLVKNIDSRNISAQGTSIIKLLHSADMFLKENRDKLLIIFTDGGDSLDYSKEIEFAKESGIKIFVIGIGSEKGSPIEIKDGEFLKSNGVIVITKFNSAIKDLALEAGGLFMNGVNSNKDIQYILDEIQKIDSDEVKKDEIPIYRELFKYPLVLALIFLFPIFYSLPNIRRFWILLFLVFPNSEIEAGMFDWYYLNQADRYFQEGNYSKAIDNYLKVKNSNEINFNIGNSYYKDGNYSKAIEKYRKIDSFELNQKALYNIGNAYVELGELQKAKTVYEKALEVGESSKVRENLEWVKNKIENSKDPKDKNQEQQKKEKSEDQNQTSENGEKEESQDGKQQDGEKKDGNKDENDKSQKGDKPENQDKVDSRKGETDNQDKKDSENSQESEDNKSKEDKVAQQIDENLTEIRDLNSSEQQTILGGGEVERREDMEEIKLLQMLDRMKGGTKIYSIPTNLSTDGFDQNKNPW